MINEDNNTEISTSHAKGVVKENISKSAQLNGHLDVKPVLKEESKEEVKGVDVQFDQEEKKLSEKATFDIAMNDDYVFETLLDYFSLNEIYLYIYPLNKSYEQRVEEANYLMFRKMADKLHITSTYLTSDLPAKRRIIDVYKETIEAVEENKVMDLKPHAFFTDSGLVGTNMWYSFHNIFETSTSMYSGYVFSSNKGANNHVQSYMCVPGSYDNTFSQKYKNEFEVSPGSKEIRVPYEKFPGDGSDPTFKIPKIFEINCRNQGYWYYVDNLALFFSEEEVDSSKFQKSTKYFDNFKNVADVKDNSNLPILHVNTEEKGMTVIEFDLSKKHEMMKTMGISKFVSMPLLYIHLDKNVTYGKTVKYEIKQNVAAKYMSMKLLCCTTYQSSNQLDMFPWALKGISLNF